MKLSARIASFVLALAVAGAIAVPAYNSLATAQQAPAAQPATFEWPKGWAKDRSDLPSDPDYTLGQLPNGMRYVILPNKNPPNQVAYRLVINAGSMQERAGEEGVAHFLEHLAFRGTANYPDGMLQYELEGIGLQMGIDVNASTSADRTTFIFNMAKNDQKSLDTGLKILRDITGAMNIAPAMVNAERGVVLAEERTRAGPAEEASKAFMKLQLGNHPFARSPIGLRSVIETVTSEGIRKFYDAFYRPERATLIVVGDVKPADIIPLISERFTDWKGRGEPGRDPLPVTKAPPAPDVVVQVTPGAGDTNIMLRWFEPYKAQPPTKAERRRQLVESLGAGAVNMRMQGLNDAAGRPASFVSSPSATRIANVWAGQMAQSVGVTDAPKTIDLMVKAYRQAQQFGITQDELDRVKEIRLTSAKQAAAAGRTTPSAAQSDVVASMLAGDPVFVSLPEGVKLLEEQMKSVTQAEVNANLKTRLQGKPTLIYRGATPPAGGEAALRTAFNKALAAPVKAYVPEAVKDWPYASFGTPGKVAERKEATDLGVTMVRFENGVRLTVKPMDVRKDQIAVQVRLGLGRLQMPRDVIDASDMGLSLWSTGGLNKLSVAEQGRTLAGKRAFVDASTADDAYTLDNPGLTTRTDFALQMQVMAAMVSDPAYRADEWASLMAAADRADEALELSASGSMARDLDELLHSGDLRWTINNKSLRDTWKPADSVKYIKPIVANSPIEVIIVGDVDVQVAIDETAKTLGALSKRPELKEPADLRDVKFPKPGNAKLTHKGRADQGYTMIAWPTQGFFTDLKASRIGDVLGQMVRDNATRKFRSEGGATYSPTAAIDFSPFLPNYGYIGVLVEVPPAMLDQTQSDIMDIAAALYAFPQAREEINRVTGPLVEALRRERASSMGYWMSSLANAQTNPKVLEALRTEEQHYLSITPADVHAAARKWLKPEMAWKLRVEPRT